MDGLVCATVESIAIVGSHTRGGNAYLDSVSNCGDDYVERVLTMTKRQ